jgi:tRNA A-37 threonylcarbamoyl transferase component Bud32
MADGHSTTRLAVAAQEPQRQQPRLVGPGPASTPSGRKARPLPENLLKQASRRLEIISLLAALLWVITTVLYHLIDRAGDPAWLYPRSSDAIVGVGVAMSLSLFLYVRHGVPHPKVVVDLALVYMVGMALVTGVIQHWDPTPHDTVAPMFSWNGVSVLLFAALMPTHPTKFFVAGLITVSMTPIGMLIARARGTWHFDSSLTAWTMHYPDFLIVGVSVVVSRVVWGLGQQVARAQEMGSYQLGDLIGRGGMGEVYKATHRMLARPAAIKLIRPEMMAARSGEKADIVIARFHREAAAVAQLRSPHTVDLYDFGATSDGTLYFAMELLDGMDLETLVRQTGPLPAARVVHILRQVCDSLEEAHASGLVHRDIKPANLHIGRVGLRHDFVKVLDFGLVTSQGAAGGVNQLATGIGTVPGTPAYMAPEMVLGEPVDGRADIYALGCAAYYLLTGQLVFAAENAMQGLVKRLHEEPAPPSSRTELPIGADLEALVLACLAKESADRPSAGDLARSLAAVKVAPWTEELAREWWRRHRPDHTAVVDAPPRAS